MGTYDIVITGHILAGADRAQVIDKAATLLKLERKKVDALLKGTPKTVKHHLDKKTAEKYVAAISRTGMACKIVTVDEGAAKQPDATPASLSDQPSQCPKCGFAPLPAQYHQYPDAACPICGIVLSKYAGPEPAPGPPSIDQGPASLQPGPIVSDLSPRYIDVPKNVRVAAGFGSLLVPGVLYWLCFPVLMTMTGGKGMALFFGLLAVWLVVCLFYFVIFPSSKGGTWAQRFVNIEIIRNTPEKGVTMLTWLIRGVCQWVYLLPLVVMTVIVVLIYDQPSEWQIAVCSLLWLGLLLYLAARKAPRSIPDILSGTRQVWREGMAPPFTGTLWAIAAVCFLISFGGLTLGRFMVAPQGAADRATAAAKTSHIILQQVCRYQADHYAKYGCYQEDPMLLLEHCANIKSPRNGGLLKAAGDNILYIEITEDGFLCAMPVPDTPGRYFVYTEAGDQGIREGAYSNRYNHRQQADVWENRLSSAAR